MPSIEDAAPDVGKGAAVWLDMDQKTLDDAYDQSIWAPNAAQTARRRDAGRRRVLAKLGPPVQASYGPTDIESVLIFRAPVEPAPIFVFVHGGAWRGGRAEQAAFFAENILDAGAHLVSIDFIDVIAAGGDLAAMLRQIRSALVWIHRHAAQFGGDASRLVLCGHSSGAHLAGCALTTDWRSWGLPQKPIAGALLSSGMYDLTPVRLSKRSAYVAFTDAMVEDLSSIRHFSRVDGRIILTCGDCESPEFQRQAHSAHAALRAIGKDAELRIGIGLDHFESQETLANPYGFLGEAARDLIFARHSTQFK